MPKPNSITDYLNQLDAHSLTAVLTKCCGAQRWVELLVAERPFANHQALLQTATHCWWRLDRADWLEAFAAHPKIGEIDSLREKFANTRTWASGEQAGVATASEAILQRLAQLNGEYETRFGYIFIVCATNKNADEILAILASRLPNDPQIELRIAAAEQLQITLLRLQKLAG